MYLGIDQSLQSTGVSVISHSGARLHLETITPKKQTGVVRLAFIRDALYEVLLAHPGMKQAALEGYAYDVGAGRVFELGEVGGAMKMALHDAAIPFVVVPPASLKLFVAGKGSASKDQMREAVLRKWKEDIQQNDACDAYGLAQVARSFHLTLGSTRDELEVLKKLKDTGKKISLAPAIARVVST